MTSGDAGQALPRGRRLGVDVGSVRVGFCQSDPDGLIATPVDTLPRDQIVTLVPPRGTIDTHKVVGGVPSDVQTIVEFVREYDAAVVYVGLPRHLSGEEGESARIARDYAGLLAGLIAPVEVRLVDERMTTVAAHRVLQAAGRSRRKHRAVVDQVAAVEILQGALDAERASGARAGELIPANGTAGD
ncbi:Holliday junction resolvase RuvX [Rarobacter incanus]|uniref:Putative pre-16S rRNA nuclease n=1 Tax=Rarobacter incanus TaxID=153494 RepID=A0A542SLT7_9MICO|nr:Holliday junction resolvase RuvX [Rarobacter incanus]TQK75591.1 putative Holliday junction resolvase [Rarobacter incanus]